MHQAMKILDAQAAVEKEKEKLEKIPAWQLTNVRNKKEEIDEARNKGRKVHFASLMDICHLKHSELEPQYQKHRGRVVLRGDIVKDDSGSLAEFTEQGSSAFQMTAAKVMDIVSTLPGCSGPAAGAVSACTQAEVEDASTSLTKFQSQNVQIHGYIFHNTNGRNRGQTSKTPWFLSNKICTVTLWPDYGGTGYLRKFYWNTVGKKFLN